MTLTRTSAVAGKGNNGTCSGHIWLRVRGDTWGAWANSETQVLRTSPSGTFSRVQFKGCNESYCTTYTVYL